MKRYCIDTSGFTTPLENMPEDIHGPMWKKVQQVITAGHIAVTVEIYEEMCHIVGGFGAAINASKKQLVLDVGDKSWNWSAYKACAAQMQTDHHNFLSEYCGNSPKTVCLNDISIIALAKAHSLPVVSSEASAFPSPNKRKIPDVCKIEGVKHMTFNEFLRAEKIRN